MADNTTLNAGAGGDTVAADEIAGVKYQRTKTVIGADGSNDGDVSQANPLPVRENGRTSTITKTNSSAANVTVLGNNNNRLCAFLYNDSTSNVYVKYGAVATNDDFTKLLLPNDWLEVKGYTGIIDAIWASANGKMRATEITP